MGDSEPVPPFRHPFHSYLALNPIAQKESSQAAAAPELHFEGGTVRIHGLERAKGDLLPSGCVWDDRSRAFRAPAIDYAAVVLALRAAGFAFADFARKYEEFSCAPKIMAQAFPYQSEALQAWSAHRSRGVVVLPTGAGKTYVATLAIAARKRSTLVIVPTLDLLSQWYDGLSAAFECEVGIVGGGYHEVRELTVSTYDSAALHMDRFGSRFGLVIFDECHHLPSDHYALAARMSIAPFRLGLTATPERADGRTYESVIGPFVYRREITELSGEYLAAYSTIRLRVPLTADERLAYESARTEYLEFLRANRIRVGEPGGWQRFLMVASRTAEGRRAFEGYRTQRMLALAAPGKLEVLEGLLKTHRRERVLVFTEDNATAYAISRRFLIPAITHQTRIKERSFILASLSDGTLGAAVTSKVLNEGVNVPAASVAIILSGSGSVREHVQRLGRILRKATGKQAVLYELIAEGTAEEQVSERRRSHVAYS